MSAPTSILVVEDEPAIAESVAYALRREGFDAVIAADLETARKQLAHSQLLILDLMLPDGSGFELIEQLGRRDAGPAIIVLSSRDDEADRIAALESGADDYVTKPFSPREIVARVRAVLRRAKEADAEATRSPLETDALTRRARYLGTELELTRVEFDLLAEMATAPERVFARGELIDRVWGSGFAITDRTIDSHIKSLRRKLSTAGAPAQLIETVRGVGYRLRQLQPDPRSSAPEATGAPAPVSDEGT